MDFEVSGHGHQKKKKKKKAVCKNLLVQRLSSWRPPESLSGLESTGLFEIDFGSKRSMHQTDTSILGRWFGLVGKQGRHK